MAFDGQAFGTKVRSVIHRQATHINTSTVRAHLHTIYGKLHVQTRTEAVVKYLKR